MKYLIISDIHGSTLNLKNVLKNESFDKLLLPTFNKKELDAATPIATGLAAGPGAGTGKLAFTAEDAERRHQNGEKVVLTAREARTIKKEDK